jgi:hypothetical protein
MGKAISIRRPMLLAIIVGTASCRQLLEIDAERPLLPAVDLVDAGVEADAPAPPSYCASLDPQPRFCADFDGDEPVDRRWDNGRTSPDPYVTGGAALVRDDAHASAPHSAKMETPLLVAPDTASVALVKSFIRPPKRLVVDFEVRIETEDFREAGQVIQLVNVTLSKAQLAIGRNATGLTLATFVDGKQSAKPSTIKLPVGTWNRLTLIVVEDEVSLHVGGNLAAVLPWSAPGGTARASVGVGALGVVGPMGPFRANVDNVTITSDVALEE